MQLPKPFEKKIVNEIVCGNCSHSIVQEVDTGKWFHQNRDPKDACLHLEKNVVCKCEKANPFNLSNNRVKSVPVPPAPIQEEEYEDSPLPTKEFSLGEVYHNIRSQLVDYTLEESIIILEGLRQEFQVIYTLQNVQENKKQ